MKMNLESKYIWWEFMKTISFKFNFENSDCFFNAESVTCECGNGTVEKITRTGIKTL